MTRLSSADPRLGTLEETSIAPSSHDDVRQAVARAHRVAPVLEGLGRDGRAAMLRALAASLEAARSGLVSTADRETALGETRLNGELTRTVYQLRLFADSIVEGSYLEAAIDTAGSTDMGPRPDLRRMLIPLGVVAVFGASNFPFAFSVPGGDTASALASGCPVVVKAHEAHPLTSQRCFEALRRGLDAADVPQDAIQIVFGRQAGIDLVSDPDIQAVGFTGSLAAGKALLDAVGARPNPIPFYGELSGLNPLVVTPRASDARWEQIATDLVSSFTLGAGQFCTKPGLAFVPVSASGDRLVAAMAGAVEQSPEQVLLTGGIATSYESSMSALETTAGVVELASGESKTGHGFFARTRLFTVDAAELSEELTHECFGPMSLIVRYADDEELVGALERLESSLTTTIQHDDDERALPSLIEKTMRNRTGRFVFNGFPTGVAVAWAQHHGGPWPSTNSLHSSVGMTAIRRFLRPMAWQSAPQALLPAELRDDCVSIPRRVDGRLVLPSSAANGGSSRSDG